MTNSFIQKLLLLFCLYLPLQLATNPAPGIDLASGRIFALLLFGAWIIASLKSKKFILPYKIQTLLVISFLFLNAVSLLYAENIEWSARKLFFLLSFFPLYFILASITKNNSEKIAKYLVFGAGLAATIGILQFLLQFIFNLTTTLQIWSKIIPYFLGASFSQSVLENSSWMVNLSGSTVFRAISLFPDPHMFSYYLGMTLPWALMLSFSKIKHSKLFLILFFLILTADLLTFSRGGYMGLLAGIIYALFFFRKKISHKSKRGILIIAVLATLILLIPNPINKRFLSSFNFFEGSNQGRIETWKQSLSVIRNNPVLGVGLGNYPLEIKPSTDYREPIYSHNLYLDIAVETGLFSLIIWIFLIITSLRAFLRQAHINQLYFAGAASLVIFSAHSLFETPLFSIHILPLLLIFIALSAKKITNE